MARKGIVTVVGAGYYGSTTAQRLAEYDIFSKVVLTDIKDGWAEGLALDLNQSRPIEGFGTEVVGRTTGTDGSGYEVISGSEVVVITAGLPRKPGMSRMDLIEVNAKIVRSVVENIAKHAPEAVAVDSEPEETKALYGLDDDKTRDFGRRCLLARRLVERGVRFVQLYAGGAHNDSNWDAHGDLEKNHNYHAGRTDKPIAGLLKDLKRRGLLDETLVVLTTDHAQLTGENFYGIDGQNRGNFNWYYGADADETYLSPQPEIQKLIDGTNANV